MRTWRVSRRTPNATQPVRETKCSTLKIQANGLLKTNVESNQGKSSRAEIRRITVPILRKARTKRERKTIVAEKDKVLQVKTSSDQVFYHL
jgi:hypothetical protein